MFPQIAPQGATTIIISILFIGALQMLSVSIIGQYIGKIFEEVKRRPKYINKSIINQPKRRK
jgi:dolichol-phosphate mannosyltransferase